MNWRMTMTENAAAVETTPMTSSNPNLSAEQQWALRMADIRHTDIMSTLRLNHQTSTAAVEEIAAAAASAQVANEEVANKVAAIFETVVPMKPKGFLDGAIYKLNTSLDTAWRVLRPAAAVAVTVSAGAAAIEYTRRGRAARAASAAVVQGAPTL